MVSEKAKGGEVCCLHRLGVVWVLSGGLFYFAGFDALVVDLLQLV